MDELAPVLILPLVVQKSRLNAGRTAWFTVSDNSIKQNKLCRLYVYWDVAGCSIKGCGGGSISSGRRIEVVYVRIGACPTNVATKSSRQDQIAAVDPSFCYQRDIDVRILP